MVNKFEETGDDLATGVIDVSRYLEFFHVLGWSGSSVRSGEILTALALFALVAALLVSAWEAYRGRRRLLPGILWIAALMLINVPNFILSEDIPHRTSRFLFVMHGLCLSCLVLAILEMKKAKGTRGMIAASLLAAGVPGVYLAAWIWAEYTVLRVLDLIEGAEPVIRSRFDVYYADNQLLYLKERCTGEDVTPRFFLRVFPTDPDDLERPYYNKLDFNYHSAFFRKRLDDGRCVIIRPLPDYAIKRFKTGQFAFAHGEGRLWQGDVILGGGSWSPRAEP